MKISMRSLLVVMSCFFGAAQDLFLHERPQAEERPVRPVHHAAPPKKWKRTRCGSPMSPGIDIITEFGLKITPDNVKSIFGYPRPQMTRSKWHSLNGLWEFTQGFSDCRGARNCDGEKPPFNTTLNQTVLVPFPVESCLSGLENASLPGTAPTYQRMVYRTKIDGTALRSGYSQAEHEVLLHFGAVDWQADVYVNGLWVGSHQGGYDGFTFGIADALEVAGQDLTELVVVAHDPSNYGAQPFGKQRSSAMWRPAGDTYTSTSGIWQTVWLEVVPAAHISSLRISPNSTHLNMNVLTSVPFLEDVSVEIRVWDGSTEVASTTARPYTPFSLKVPEPKLWSPEQPFLYNLSLSYGTDAVDSYFGMRDVGLCKDATGVIRPCINNKYRFLTGVLDQGFWSDGIYAAPGDEALVYDLQLVQNLGLNFIRKHQKVEPDRWYYHADRMGIVVAQDVVQHYGDDVQGQGKEFKSNNGRAQLSYYWHDLKALVDNRASHPSIVQYATFNEQDMDRDMDVPKVVQWLQHYDPTRLVDAVSGGAAYDPTAYHAGDIDDRHVGEPTWQNLHDPGAHQYMMDGETTPDVNFWTDGHTWTDSSNLTEVCRLYDSPDSEHPVTPSGTPHDMAVLIAGLSHKARALRNLSVMVYTCLHDTEQECDGIYNYDRAPKLSKEDLAVIRAANIALVGSPTRCKSYARNMTMPVGRWPRWMLA